MKFLQTHTKPGGSGGTPAVRTGRAPIRTRGAAPAKPSGQKARTRGATLRSPNKKKSLVVRRAEQIMRAAQKKNGYLSGANLTRGADGKLGEYGRNALRQRAEKVAKAKAVVARAEQVRGQRAKPAKAGLNADGRYVTKTGRIMGVKATANRLAKIRENKKLKAQGQRRDFTGRIVFRRDKAGKAAAAAAREARLAAQAKLPKMSAARRKFYGI